MAYYTGQVSSYAEMISIINEACVANGYTLINGILSKDNFFIKLSVGKSTEIAGNPGPGILLNAARGQSGSSLLQQIPNPPRIGSPSTARNALVWPATYHLHINNKFSEVFIIINYNVSCFYWGAWGVSNLKDILGGYGNWVGAISSTNNVSAALYGESPSQIGSVSIDGDRCSCLLFGEQNFETAGAEYATSRIDHNVGSVVWSKGYRCSAIALAQPVFSQQPNTWNSESVLIPIRVACLLPSSKTAVVAEIDIARYIRIDNLEPLQVLTIGHEKWKVYPAYKKDTSSRDGGAYKGHSGTIGFAVRYDGP